jgi:hypothetical protein
MPPAAQPVPPKRALLLIPIAVLLTIHPLLIHGPSCGQDLTFHLQSWLDAAQQLRHGTLYPHWDITAAWNAGEPRFLFYPPLSWLLGAALTLIFPLAACPTIFIAIALLASGLTFHKLASQFASPNAALIASALYLANPYMLFCAFERSAFAELLAAAWIPLLLLALLRPRPTPGSPAGSPAGVVTIRSIAIPLALLWLTNAPAAVIGSYTLALFATLRILSAIAASIAANRLQAKASASPTPIPPKASTSATLIPPKASTSATLIPPKASTSATPRYPEASASGPMSHQNRRGFSPGGTSLHEPIPPLSLALTYLAGTLLGLTLPAIYLLPAACERRFIQTSMAIIPTLRYQDNFLFAHTADAAHNAVNHTISLLALTLLVLTAAALLTLRIKTISTISPTKRSLFLIRKTPAAKSSILPFKKSPPTAPPLTLSEVSRSHARETPPKDPPRSQHVALPLALLTLSIALLLTPLSAPVWQHLPDLAYLQFPWRLLILLTPILALTIALFLDTCPRILKLSPSAQDPGAPSSTRAFARQGGFATATLALLLPLALTALAYSLYHQPFDPADNPTALAHLFTTHHGFPPTDEYTPTLADNDPLRTNNPAYWLLPLNGNQAADPNTPAPNTLPTATELNPSLDSNDTDDTPLPPAQTLSTPAPHHLTLTLTQPSLLVLNLRAYPNWHITTTPKLSPSAQDSAQARNDGLITLQLPPGPSTLTLTWRHTLDQQLGPALTLLSLLALALTFRRPQARKIPA